MRKIISGLLCCIVCNTVFGQATTALQQKLYYTCKVWGFVKYYHSNVSTCHVDWDSVLIKILPVVESAYTDSAFNDALDTMLAKAGPMALSTTYFPDTLPANLKRNRDFSWMGASIFRSDVQVQLDTICNNFRPHPGCYVGADPYETTRGTNLPWGGLMEFGPDTIILPTDTYYTMPDEPHRLLELFKFWNIIRYFNPYNYVLDIPWDTTLYHYVIPVANVTNADTLYSIYTKIATNLNDAHVYGLTYDYFYQTLPGYYLPFIRLKYVDSQYVVINSLVPGINIGDVIISVDGLTTAQWEDSLRPFYSSGNQSLFRRTMCQNMLGRQWNNTVETLVVQDSTGANHTLHDTCINWYTLNPAFFENYYYPADSLDNIKWTTMDCGIGYVNMGNLQQTDVNAMYIDLMGASAIIFDLRNYPNNTAWDIANLMYPTQMQFAEFMYPDTTYPGTGYWYHDYLGTLGNPYPYSGKVIILMNEETQSQAEFTCMALSAMPGSIKIGSQTAGADGDVTWFLLSYDMSFGYTSLGTYYPNGDSTQRIGIVPDSVVYPTKAGIRQHNDEVLNTALNIACSQASIPAIKPLSPTVRVFPNPCADVINIYASNTGTNNTTIQVTDIWGRLLMQKETENTSARLSASMDISALAPGIYFVKINTASGQIVKKMVKE